MMDENATMNIKNGYPNRTMILLPLVVRKYSGKVAVVFCLIIALIMGMETSYLSTFASMQEFQTNYGKSSMLLRGLLQSCYPLAASSMLKIKTGLKSSIFNKIIKY
jgi:hypothetical protein